MFLPRSNNFSTSFINILINKNLVLLQINIEVNSGSTGRIAEQIGEVAIKYGFDSYITYARGFNASKSKVLKIGNKISIFIHLLKTRLFGEHLNGSKRPTLRLIQRIIEINPEIIHLHQMHGYYLNIPILFEFLKKFNKPIIWTLHDCWAFTGHCSYFTVVGCEKWKMECNQCPQFNKYPKSVFFDKSRHEFNTKKQKFNSLDNLVIVGVSNWIANLARISFLKDHKIITVYNGIDTKVFSPRENRSKVLSKYNLSISNRYLIASGTTWIKSKGLDDYVKLAEELPVGFELILVGIDESTAKKLSKRINCIKRTESQDVLAELYSASDALLCLSYQEAFGLTPIESFACGTPAIVYDNTALAELVTPETGIKVETGNLKMVMEAIDEIRINGKNYYSENCITRAKQFYDKNQTYLGYIQIYNELIEKNT